MKPIEVLTAGRELIADPKNWTQRTLARNKNGDPLPDPWDKSATCFCSVGAIHKVTPRGTENLELKRKVTTLLCIAAEVQSIVQFNDRHTHTEVLDVWDKAIVLANHE